MTIPKWLLPAISIIAAVAVGVTMALVGVNFASKTVVEKAAGTMTAQVLQPVATGLTKADLSSPSANKGVSPVTGAVTVSRPGGKSIKPPLNREVDLIASGGSAPATSTPGPTATPLPDAESLGVTPYVPGPSVIRASDPCAVSAVSSCPDGLRSVILALTAPPAPDFSIEPFEAPCTPTTTADPRFEDRSNVQVTLVSTVPMSYSVHFQSDPELGVSDPTFVHGIVTAATDTAAISEWNAARAADVSASSLPPLTGCAHIPEVWSTGGLQLDVTGTAADGTVLVRHLSLNPSGPGTPGPLRIQTFGSDAFVAYGEFPTNQSLRITAYTMSHPTDATCNDTSALTMLAPVYSRTGVAIDAATVSDANLSTDYTQRTAVGFRVLAGAVVLMCAAWYHGAGSASFDRRLAIRTSQVVVESSQWVGFVESGTVFRHMEGAGVSLARGDIARVIVYGTLDDGTRCGDTFDWHKGQLILLGQQVDLCTAPVDETLDSDTGFANTPERADANITIETYGTDGHRAHSVFRINLEKPVCDGCTAEQIEEASYNHYRIPLPDPYFNPFDEPGGTDFSSGWDPAGTSGTDGWVVSPALNAGAETDPIGSGPQLNTDTRLVVDTARTTATDVTARLDYSASKSGSYSLKLLSGTGGAPCTTNGATSVVVGGLYPTARATVPIHVPHLCHGATYLAQVAAIDGLDYRNYESSDDAYTLWGYAEASGWYGFLLSTPAVPVLVVYAEVVNVPAGSALTDLSLHLDGVDVHPSDDLSSGCASQRVAHIGRAAMSLSTHTQLHLQYRLRHITSAAGAACTFPTTDVAPLIDAYQTIDLNAVMAHPAGIQITSGPYTINIQVVPAT
jgi:hypothetical protein